MISFINNSELEPFKILKDRYELALNNNQKNIEAICISSFCSEKNEVDSRYVNLKIIDNERFIFFTNYNSYKAKQFELHNQISAVIYWPSINTQIRMNAVIKKTSKEFNQKYFSTREKSKNALAISSNQSLQIDSYKDVKKKYKKTLSDGNLNKCPDYWGGYEFKPNYFEFWKGMPARINKRVVYKLMSNDWKKYFLEP